MLQLLFYHQSWFLSKNLSNATVALILCCPWTFDAYAKGITCINGYLLHLCTWHIYMTASRWWNRLITTFSPWHSPGIVTAMSMSVNTNPNILCTLYSVDFKYNVAKNNSGNRELHRCENKRTSKQWILCFPEKIQYNSNLKATHAQSYKHACLLLPDNERSQWGEAGVVVRLGLVGKVCRQGDSRSLEEQHDVVREQLWGFRGEGDGE